MSDPDVHDPALVLHARSLTDVTRRIEGIGDRWSDPTPCAEWDVRGVVNHLLNEQLWVPPLLDGATVEEVGDRFDGDLLGAEPLDAWAAGAAGAGKAFAEPDSLARIVHLSYGDVPAREYCDQLTLDALVHAWDVAVATGQDDDLDPELVAAGLAAISGQEALLAASGMFGTPVDVPADADPQTRLLAALGRDRARWAANP